MLDGTKAGQRLLLALTSETQSLEGSEFTSPTYGILLTICGLGSLILVAVLCVCGERKAKPSEQQNGGPDLNNVQANLEEGSLELRPKPAGDGNVETQIADGGQPNQMGHSRQASSCSVAPAGLRPTSLRELPEPPVSARHSRNTSMSGVELPAVPDAVPAGIQEAAGDPDSASEEYAYPKHVSPRGGGDTGKIKSHSDGYDHLGQSRPQERPINYDRLVPGKQEDDKTSPTSELGQVIDDIYSLSKEEDPYNRIGDSDGAVPASFIRHLRESSDPADPYATVEDESGGDLKSLSANLGKDLQANGKSQSANPHVSHRETQNEYEEAEEEEPEYAVVHKTRGNSQRRDVSPNTAGGAGFRSSDEMSTASSMPPEPPRLYNAYEDEYEIEASRPDHQYSRVTARESLASMSARKALNPYEMVPDGPENMYATVEGGSGDGVVIRHMDSDDNNSNRNSQSSDTYAEIGGVSVGNTNRTSLGSTSITNTSRREITSVSSTVSVGNPNTSSEAPVPPSLDSLHQMTKSQTSNEGDRNLSLSDYSGIEPLALSSLLPAWGGRSFADVEEGSGGSVSEDGYSTLKRVAEEGGKPSGVRLSSSIRPENLRDAGQRSPDYSRVRDQENDPNYEIVDEARAKMRLLYRTDKSVEEARANDKIKTSSENPPRNNVTVVRVLNPIKSVPSPSKAISTSYSVQENNQPQTKPGNSRPRRRPNHDYEELDLSPPTSPTEHTSTPMKSPTQSLAEAKLKLARSHMYEEIEEVRVQSPSLAAKTQGNFVSSISTSSSPPSSSSTLNNQASSTRSESGSVPSSVQREDTPGLADSVGPGSRFDTVSAGSLDMLSSGQRNVTNPTYDRKLTTSDEAKLSQSESLYTSNHEGNPDSGSRHDQDNGTKL